jgi:hypothetical protein
MAKQHCLINIETDHFIKTVTSPSVVQDQLHLYRVVFAHPPDPSEYPMKWDENTEGWNADKVEYKNTKNEIAQPISNIPAAQQVNTGESLNPMYFDGLKPYTKSALLDLFQNELERINEYTLRLALTGKKATKKLKIYRESLQKKIEETKSMKQMYSDIPWEADDDTLKRIFKTGKVDIKP